VTPTPATVEVLTQIWQRVLQRSPIGPKDNFFDLNGKDSLVDSLFAEIAQLFGRELPSATICYAPTIASLAALLEQPALPQFPPFVQLKAGSEKPPILIGHGLGGRANFSALAKHMGTGHPIYGIQAKGMDGREEPLKRVEEMAELYLDALSKIEPQGSCILIGYSFGGLVALEMAHRLRERGKHVALLVLVDSYPHPRYFPADQRVSLAAKRIRRHLSNMKQLPIRAAFAYLVQGIERRLHIADAHSHDRLAPEPSRLSFAQTTLRVKQSCLVAMKGYRPRFYPGKIRFVRPEANPYLPTDPTAVWKKLAAELEVEIVPGDHLEMIGTHFKSLAAVLSRYVEEAVDRK
jgi:acetoacetyl-CoA synthetase